MGRLLAARGEAPDHVISSTAVRARTSAELAKEAGGWAGEITLDRDLYISGPEGVIGVAAQAPDVPRLMLVGHQPTWSVLARIMSGDTVDMKTATVAVIEFDMSGWAGVENTRGVLTDVINPREHFGSEYDT